MGFFTRERRLPESEVEVRAKALAFDLLEKERAAIIPQIPAGYPSDLKKSPYPAYGLDNPYAFYVPQAPKRKPGSFVSVETLKLMANTYDVLRSCINHRKSEVDAIPIRFVPRDDSNDSPQMAKRLKDAEAFFVKKGGLGGIGTRRSAFECKIIEDVDVVGACAIYKQRTRGGQIYEAIALPASTIRPRVNVYGWVDENEAYEQWIMGLRVQAYAKDELIYDGLYPTTDSPYFSSPVEWLINVTTSALYAHQWNQDWLTTGNTASQLMGVPEEWTPEQIMQFQTYWDKLISQGFERVKTKFVPSSFKEISSSRKDQEFQLFEEWLMRRTCSIFEVQPASIGYPGHEYKVNQDRSMNATTQFGIGKLLEFRVDLYNDMLEENGFPDIECKNVTDQEEDAESRTARIVQACGGGYKTINEGRAEDGLDPIPDGDVIMVPNTSTTLENAVKPPEPPAQDKGLAENGQDQKADAKRWMKKATNRLGRGEPALCDFESDQFSDDERAAIMSALSGATTPDHVRAAFRNLL